MAIKTIENINIEDRGFTNEVKCPVCARVSNMKIISSADYSLLPIFLNKNSRTDFAICTECNSVFEVNPTYTQEKSAGTAVFLTTDDLTQVGVKR